MIKRFRTCVLAASAAALVSAQAAYAAPMAAASTIDPLVSLSAFGTAQSQAAVCAAGAAAAAAATAQGAPGCVLPVSGATAPPVMSQGAPLPPPGPGFAGVGAWAVIPGLLGVLALLAFLNAGDDDFDVPVSPF